MISRSTKEKRNRVKIFLTNLNYILSNKASFFLFLEYIIPKTRRGLSFVAAILSTTPLADGHPASNDALPMTKDHFNQQSNINGKTKKQWS